MNLFIYPSPRIALTRTRFIALALLLSTAVVISGCSDSSNTGAGTSATGNGSLSDVPSTDTGGSVDDEGTEDSSSSDESSGTNTTSGTNATDETSVTATEQSTNESGDGNASETITENSNETTPDNLLPQTTRVRFDITVPAFVSNALQVRLVWGEIDTTALWVIDETWTATAELPANTVNPLLVSFNDDNGAITLGSVETEFRTGSNETATFQITAGEFDINRWDNDNDGVSNFDELIAGTNPLVAEPSRPTQVGLELVPDKTFRISWQPSTSTEFYRVLENPDGVSGFTQVGEDIAESVQSFEHRVALYLRVNASYLVQACNSDSCTDSNVVRVPGSLEEAIGYIKASNSSGVNNPQVFSDMIGDRFGSTVSISANGNTLVVGAQLEDSNATGVNGDEGSDSARDSGAAYVFTRSSTGWQLQAYLKASNAEAGDTFGHAVSLSGDGDTLVVGAPAESSASAAINGTQSNNASLLAGAAYVFTRSGQTWQQQAYIKPNIITVGDNFGEAVSLNANGDTLAVGATGEDSAATGINGNQMDSSASSSGAAYVFTRSNQNWQQQAYVKASNTGEQDLFGNAISLSADGNTLAVAARREDSAARGINGNQSSNTAAVSGAVYVYRRTSEIWQQQSYIKASNTDRLDMFGSSLSLSANGQALVVGAPTENGADVGVNGRESDNSQGNSGAAYVFSQVNGNWQQQAYLKASNTEVADAFGTAVTINATGTVLAVSATSEDSSVTGINGNQNDNFAFIAGAAYVFENSNGVWQQQAYIKASNTGRNDEFGAALSISADGNSLAVGAFVEASAADGFNGNQNDNTAFGAGAVYLY